MASEAGGAKAKGVIGADDFGDPLRKAIIEHLQAKGGVEVSPQKSSQAQT